MVDLCNSLHYTLVFQDRFSWMTCARVELLFRLQSTNHNIDMETTSSHRFEQLPCLWQIPIRLPSYGIEPEPLATQLFWPESKVQFYIFDVFSVHGVAFHTVACLSAFGPDSILDDVNHYSKSLRSNIPFHKIVILWVQFDVATKTYILWIASRNHWIFYLSFIQRHFAREKVPESTEQPYGF